MNHHMGHWVLPVTEEEEGYIYFRLREPTELYLYINNININIYDECLNPFCKVRHKPSLNNVKFPKKYIEESSPHPLRHTIGLYDTLKVRSGSKYPSIKTAVYPRELYCSHKPIPRWCRDSFQSIRPFALFSHDKELSVLYNPYINVLYRLQKNISFTWDHPQLYYNNKWHTVNNWKVNRRNGVITHKIEHQSIVRHQYINGVDLTIVRCEFNILVPYFALKLVVLLKRARKRIVKWMCLRNIYKKNNCKLLNRSFSGSSNYPIRCLIFKEFM